MTVKCMLFESTDVNPAPTFKEINSLSNKRGHVIYGGGKQKSKSIPHIDKLHLVVDAFYSLKDELYPEIEFSPSRSIKLYLLEDKAVASFIQLKYSPAFISYFIIDDLIIDKLQHIKWSHDHLKSHIFSLENQSKTYEFFRSKNISDKELEGYFPAYINSAKELATKFQARKQTILGEAATIFNAGWD